MGFKQRHCRWITALNKEDPSAIESGLITASTLTLLREKYPDITHPSFFQTDKSLKISRGNYTIPNIDMVRDYISTGEFNQEELSPSSASLTMTAGKVVEPVSALRDATTQQDHIPNALDGFVPTKTSRILKKIFKSNRFYPVYLFGPTGVGKTTDVTQAAASVGRGVIRANITVETDETDLIGGYSLINGNTIFEYGPVVVAMQTGSVLLLDEVDLGSTRIMCLQPVLEGQSIYIKKTGEWIHPAPGFTVVATGNTKGRGSYTGEYVGAQYLNEAMLDRFPLFLKVDYPSSKEETEILTQYWNSFNNSETLDPAIIEQLVSFASETRKARNDGACSECVSTRRVKDILNYINIIGTSSVNVAVQATLNRFDEENQSALMRFWNIVSGSEESDSDENADSVEDQS